MCVFPFSGIIGFLFEVKGLKVDLFLFPRNGLYQLQSLVAGSLSSSLAAQGRKCVVNGRS
jgi:hypothetical protein